LNLTDTQIKLSSAPNRERRLIYLFIYLFEIEGHFLQFCNIYWVLSYHSFCAIIHFVSYCWKNNINIHTCVRYV